MESCTFLFDICIKQLNLPKDKIDEPKNLTAKAEFAGVKVPIAASRINVSDFSGPSNEISMQPDALREKLEKGMRIEVIYGGRSIGNGTIMFPETMIEYIDVQMSDLVHEDSCVLVRNNQEVGHIDMICRLTVKCMERQDMEMEVCRRAQIATDIKPQDIFFLVAKANSCPDLCEPCVDELEAEQWDEMLALDLQRYRTANRRVEYPPDNEPAPCGMPACCQLKKLVKEFESIIDKITEKVAPKPMSNMSQSRFNPCPGQLTNDLQPYWKQAGYDGSREYAVNHSMIPVSIDSQFDEQQIKNIQFCPYCLTNMSWVPKFANCPTCNAKAVPVLAPQHQSQMTAADIMNEYLSKQPLTEEDYCVDPCELALKLKADPDYTKDACGVGCSCTTDHICVHCRVRRIYAEIVESQKPKSIKCQFAEPVGSEDFYINEEDCAPHLFRVFSELRHIYKVKSEKETLAKLDELCQGPLFRIKSADDLGVVGEGTPKKPWEIERNYPGVKIGHKDCLQHVPSVSRRHGWAWTSSKEARKYGWRPGAIRKPLESIIKFFLYQKPKCLSDDDGDEEQQLPILNVSKKNGEILITLRPSPAPGIRMRPIVFRVVKSQLALAMREIKRRLKLMGIAKCTCHKPLMLCVCRPYLEKKAIERILSKECERLCMPSCVDKLVLTDTSASEMEYDFEVTPPGGMPRPVCTHTGPKIINHATQTSKADKREPPPKYPSKLNPYKCAFDCATGGRFRGTIFGQPGENVFEDGVFGWRGGGMHGQPPAPQGRKQNTFIWGTTPGAPMRRGARSGAGPQLTSGPDGFGATAWKGLAAKVMHNIKQSNNIPIIQNKTKVNK